MRVFVVGGTGVIGLPSVRALAEAGHQVRASARGEAKEALVRARGGEPVQVDIDDVEDLRRAMRGCDAVIRLTTKIPSLFRSRFKSAWKETNHLRTEGAERIVTAALAEGVGIYMHESFYSVYADAGDDMVEEESPTWDGGIPAMKAALDGEGHACRFAAAGGRGIVLRFGGFYGAEAPSTQEMAALVQRRMLPLIGDSEFYFPSIYLDDAARAVVHALDAPSGIYNICDDEPMQWSEFLQVVSHALDAPPPRRLPAFLGPLAMGYPWRWLSRSVRMSNTRFWSAAGWRPGVRSAREGWPLVARTLSQERWEASIAHSGVRHWLTSDRRGK